MNRRHILFGLGATIGGSLLYQFSPYRSQRLMSASRSRLLVSHSDNPMRGSMDGVALRNSLGYIAEINLTDFSRKLTAVPLFGHEPAVNPVDLSTVFISEKWGYHAALVDLSNSQVKVHKIEKPGQRFYGHACFSSDGSHIFSAEMNDTMGRGVLCIRNARTLDVVDEYDSGGVYPHQLALVNGGQKLAVMNNASVIDSNQGTPQGPSKLTIFDLASMKIVEVRIAHEPSFFHFVFSERDNSFYACGNLPQPDISKTPESAMGKLGAKDQTTFNFSKETGKRLSGEALSIALHPTKAISAVTLPTDQSVLIIDLIRNKLLQKITFIDPCRAIGFSFLDSSMVNLSERSTHLDAAQESLLFVCSGEVCFMLAEDGNGQWKMKHKFSGGTGSHFAAKL